VPTATATVTATGADADVVVVGAGPAGAAAALTLHRAGRSVLVVDKAVFPRDKCCGDGLTTLALRELDHLGVRADEVPSFCPVGDAVIRAPGGRTVTVPLPRGQGLFAAVTPRVELDSLLVDHVAGAGITVHQGAAVKAARAEPGRVRLDVEGLGELTARHVVAADGMWSPTRKALGLATEGYRGEWHAFRQYVSGVTGPASEHLYVWFERDMLPGYAWSFPLPGGRANVGFGVLRSAQGVDTGRSVQAMKQTWETLLDRPHLRAALGGDAAGEGRHAAWPIPARIDRATLSHGRTLFVGDAAGATDLMTGEGIGQALLTGRLAGEAIVRSGSSSEAISARYERQVRRELLADHRMSVLLGKVISRPRGAYGAIAILDHAGNWSRRNFARWMFEDEPRAIVVTPRRWHRRFLSRPGVSGAPRDAT
jgi:geranylgeranyl reductase family protein